MIPRLCSGLKTDFSTDLPQKMPNGHKLEFGGLTTFMVVVKQGYQTPSPSRPHGVYARVFVVQI